MATSDVFEIVSEDQGTDGSLEVTVRFWARTKTGRAKAGEKIGHPSDRKFIFSAEAYSMYVRFRDHLNAALDALAGQRDGGSSAPLPGGIPSIILFIDLYIKHKTIRAAGPPADPIRIDASSMVELFQKAKLGTYS